MLFELSVCVRMIEGQRRQTKTRVCWGRVGDWSKVRDLLPGLWLWSGDCTGVADASGNTLCLMKACGVYALLPTIGDHLICRQHGTFAERLGETCVRQVTQRLLTLSHRGDRRKEQY